MDKREKLSKIEKLMVDKDWIDVHAATKEFEISFEHLLNAFNDNLPVYQLYTENQIHPISKVDTEYYVDQNVLIYGHIDYDQSNERVACHSENLPTFLEFYINEITGDWVITYKPESSIKFNLDELERRDIEETYGVDLIKKYQFGKFHSETEVQRIIIEVNKDDSLKYKDHCCDNDLSFQERTSNVISVKAIFDENEYYAVDEKSLNTAKKIICNKLVFPDKASHLAYISQYAYFNIYLMPKCKVDENKVYFDFFSVWKFASINCMDYFSAKVLFLEQCKNYGIKLDELKNYIDISMVGDDNPDIQAWVQHSKGVSDPKIKRYIEYAIGKLSGLNSSQLFEKCFTDQNNIHKESSQSTAVSKFGKVVMDYAKKNNLPIWVEKRGRPAQHQPNKN